MLGWRAASNLGKHVGDTIKIDQTTFQVVGIYSTGQALGDTGAMLPLVPFQAAQRQPSELTLVFVQVRAGTDIPALRARIEADYPQLVTVRTATDFGRADRSMSLINAIDRGSGILAILVGAIIVMTTMTMTFIERTREFGVLAAIGWSRARIMGMVISEALCIGLIGAAGGVGSLLRCDPVHRPVAEPRRHPASGLHGRGVLARPLYRRGNEPAGRRVSGRTCRAAFPTGGVAP